MDYTNWKILKNELGNFLEEYMNCSIWCNDNGYHIEDDGIYYKVVPNEEEPAPTIQRQIELLEEKITNRNIRSAILGEEYALNKIRAIEAEIEELRSQLENNEEEEE